jgi:hypothetical protein
MGINVKLNDQALLDSVTAKVEQAKALLRKIADTYAPAVFAYSLGTEDMVLTDLILGNKLDIEIFSLDTGRLERKGNLGLYPPERSPVQRPARQVLPEHRLRALYACHHARRG